jgi:hypothetical protein
MGDHDRGLCTRHRRGERVDHRWWRACGERLREQRLRGGSIEHIVGAEPRGCDGTAARDARVAQRLDLGEPRIAIRDVPELREERRIEAAIGNGRGAE